MVNIICPSCKEELYVCSSLQTQDVHEDELIIILEKALCKNCKRVFDIHFGVSNIVEIGVEDDFYLDDEELGDMFVEKEDYVLLHKAFKTIEDLHDFAKELDIGNDVIEILTVADKDEDNPYVVSFEITADNDTAHPIFTVSLYIGNPTGLIIYDSYSDDIKNYNTMDEIEENCVDTLRKFTEFMTSLNQIEEVK